MTIQQDGKVFILWREFAVYPNYMNGSLRETFICIFDDIGSFGN